MADYLVSALVRTIIETLSSASRQEIGLLWGLKDELDSLESTFTTLQLVLADAEIKQRKSPPIQNWLRKLKDVAYDAENVLDEMAIETHKRKMGSKRGMSFLGCINPLIFKFKMAHKVKSIREKLSGIAEERLKFHLGESVMENRFGVTLESRKTCSLVNEAEMHGREEEKELMMEKLLDDRRGQDDLCVYGICGMGGLGKTTLAQLLYNDARTKSRFELRMWVCVSDDFNIQRLVKAIVESIGGGGCDVSELDPLQCLLRERLRGRRFLLVLDDVWNENGGLWDGLKEILRCDSKGSVLVVTTRIEKVASMMATNGVHRIGYLNEEDSWSLFKQRAFPNDAADESLVAIGKAIVKKCGGVPLAIKALGGLMRFKSGESEWLAIKESEIWRLSDDDSGILPALRLSYDNLLPHVRQCFAYCCLYPKDRVMKEYELVQLWMANGFIPDDDQTDLFLTGRLIFKELVWRCFFQDIRECLFRKTCKMHDLIHDLAVSVMRHETCILELGSGQKIPKTVRHLSFVSSSSGVAKDVVSELKLQNNGSVLSFISLGLSHLFRKKTFTSFLSKQQYIRALDMTYSGIENLPKLVCKLEHLRYLCMSCFQMKRLPDSLSHLYNLQTLKLMDCTNLLELPKEMRLMKNLWFLELSNFDSLLCTPPGLGELTFLRGLSIFIVGQDASQQIDQLKELNLGGQLSIQGLHNVMNLEEAKGANLMAKKNLISLTLCWPENVNSPQHNAAEVLQGLQPHCNLERIRIEWYQGSKFPDWMSSSAFTRMEEISLFSCPRCEQLPTMGKLPCLRHLRLSRMDSVKRLGGEWYGDAEISFPVLAHLGLFSMWNLEEWCLLDSVESFPCLTSLVIDNCPKLDALPSLSSLKDLRIFDCNAALDSSMMWFTSLKSFTLHHRAKVEVLAKFSVQRCVALEKLQLRGPNIGALLNMLPNFTSLKELCFDGCPDLEVLPEGLKCLNSLESLNINFCNALTSFPATLFEDLPSLTSLLIQNCEKLKLSLGPLNRRTALQSLSINSLPLFECFPESMLQFNSLRDLSISGCRNLKCLPDGFRSLTSLQRLDIYGCPQLEKKCKKPYGEDWPKICHIPSIWINNEIISSNSSV